MKFDRRQFVKLAAVPAGARVGSEGAVAAAPFQAEAATAQVYSLFDRPMRWAQLAFVESDPGNYDQQFWLDYFRRTHSEGVCLSAGGIVAFYPTKIRLHYRSAWMKDTDPFGEMVAACRKMGMVVIARTDPHAVRQAAYDAHPEWIAVEADGKKRRHWANPELWVTCALGPYNFEFMTEVHREIMTLYQVDGIFSNRWHGHGTCYCDSCRRLFKQFSGMDLPVPGQANAAVNRQYILWRRQRLTELWNVWDHTIRTIRPSSRFIPNGPPDLKTAGEKADILFQDRQARSGLTCPWTNGRYAKELRATMGRKPIGGIFSVGLEERYRWKDSVQSQAEVRVWVAESIAHGVRPWFTKFSAVLYDRRWLKVVEDLYGWHHRFERYFRNESPIARVGLVYSEQTADFYDRGKQHQNLDDHLKGAYHALVEARIPFEMVHDNLLDPAGLKSFKLLILPNIAALSVEQCRQLSDYVKAGGSLVATFETSLYDEWGEPRPDFGLKEIFGVSHRKLEGPLRNSYLNLEADPATGKRHPVLQGLEDAPRIVNGVYRLDVQPLIDFPSPLTLIPSYPDLPMEDVFPRVQKTTVRELYLREIGSSRVAYFPWDLTRTFWEVLAVDHARLIANTVRWAANEEQPVVVSGPGIIDISAWRQKDSMTVHLVNLTNPMMMKGPIRELIPIGEQSVRIRLPEGKKPRRVQLLVAGAEPRVERPNATELVVNVPSVLAHEVVAIDW